MNEIKSELLALAKGLGAVDAVLFSVEDIAFDPRTLIKCMFGCPTWGKGLTCPSRPGSLKPWEYEMIFKRYSWGIIIHTHDPHLSQEISFILESQAFQKGFTLLFL